MSKGRKQLLTAFVLLLVVIGGYSAAKNYSADRENQQQAEEAAGIVQVTDFDIADVVAFSYVSADLEVSFELEGENWKYTSDESLEINTEKIESFLENFNAIETDNEIADAENMEEFGLEEELSWISFEFEDGESLTCTVGEYNDVMGVYYFKTDAGDTVYTVDGTVVNKLSNTVDNFIVEAEETETVEETTSE